MTDPTSDGPKRLLVVGDTHGDWVHWERELLPAAREHQVDGIVQLGDFGYWPLTSDGLDYLAWLSSELDQLERVEVLIFVDGNHEDHKALLQLPTRPDGFVAITDRIMWAPRGHRWTWQGVRFLALGGAFSIDRADRKLDSGRWGWFKEEVLTERQAAKAKGDGGCDVLLTHDAPEATVPSLMGHSILLGGYRPAEAKVTPKLIEAVAEATRPGLLLHGHWHQFADSHIPLRGHGETEPDQRTRVVGLACNAMDRSWCVLELPSLQLQIPRGSGQEHLQ